MRPKSLRKSVVFDGVTSAFHFFLGFVTKYIHVLNPLVGTVVALTVALSYLWYQVREPENPFNKLGDFVEYIYGYVVADIIW